MVNFSGRVPPLQFVVKVMEAENMCHSGWFGMLATLWTGNGMACFCITS